MTTKFQQIVLPDEFKNPFDGLPDEQTSKLQSVVPRDIHWFIKCLRQETGTIETTINILYAKLYNACLERGILDYTSAAEFEQFIVNCQLTDGPRGTAGSPLQQTSASNDRTTTPGRSNPTSQPPGQPPSVPSVGKNVRQRKGN